MFDLTVALDYGQFYLTGVYEVDDDADPLLRLLEEAISGGSSSCRSRGSPTTRPRPRCTGIAAPAVRPSAS